MDIDVVKAYRTIEKHGFEGVGFENIQYMRNGIEEAYKKVYKEKLERVGGFKVGEEAYLNAEGITNLHMQAYSYSRSPIPSGKVRIMSVVGRNLSIETNKTIITYYVKYECSCDHNNCGINVDSKRLRELNGY